MVMKKNWHKEIPVCNTHRRAFSGLVLLKLLLCATEVASQVAPPSPDRPWHSSWEQGSPREGEFSDAPKFSIDSSKTYSLGDLIDLAETHNPETRLAWERARSQAATLGLARSELYPTLAATALSQITRGDDFFGTTYYRQTIQESEGGLELNYTVFDFGARSGRINAAMADHLEGKTLEGTDSLKAAFARLKDSVRNFGSAKDQGALTAHVNTFLTLAEKIMGLTISLDKDLHS
jgi:outer membrane protein TolC